MKEKFFLIKKYDNKFKSIYSGLNFDWSNQMKMQIDNIINALIELLELNSDQETLNDNFYFNVHQFGLNDYINQFQDTPLLELAKNTQLIINYYLKEIADILEIKDVQIFLASDFTNRNKIKIIERLKKIKNEKKFQYLINNIDDEVIDKMSIILNDTIDSIISLIQDEVATISKVLIIFKKSLLEFDEIGIRDTEDRERIAEYIDILRLILGIRSTDGLLNKWV